MMMDGVLLLVLLLPTVAAALANAALLDTRRAKQLESTVRQAASSILIVDGENVRGKSLFQLSHTQLMARLARWSARHKLADRVVLLVDHGTQPSAFHLPRLGGLSVVFSGPTLSAGDVAARDLEWLHGRGHDVLLVTADSGLAQRCRLAGRAGSRSLQVVPPQALLAALGHKHASAPKARADDYVPPPPDTELSEAQLAAIENEMKARAALTRADRAVYRVKNNKKKLGALQKQRIQLRAALDEALAASTAAGAPSLQQLVDDGELGGYAPEEQEAMMAAIIHRRQVRPISEQWVEHTYERVVLAEMLRRRLEKRCDLQEEEEESHVMGPSAAYVAMVNGAVVPPPAAAISSTGDAITASSLFSTDVNPAVAGSLAALQDETEMADVGSIEHIPLAAEGEFAPRSLVVSLRDATRPIVGVSARPSAGKTKRERQRKRRHAMLGYVHQPTRRQRAAAMPPPEPSLPQQQPQQDEAIVSPPAETLPPDGQFTRLVVISDTHGHEESLPDTLPEGEVLVHCGDWSSGSGRNTAEATAAAARLDEWLSKQPQQHKIIIRGNHDPFDVKFPLSNAVYVTSPISLHLGGVTFACVPYSRGPLRGTLPKGEVLVTHVPPKRLLDRTYTGEEAGDQSLRKAVKTRATSRGFGCLGTYMREAARAVCDSGHEESRRRRL